MEVSSQISYVATTFPSERTPGTIEYDVELVSEPVWIFCGSEKYSVLMRN